jgi:hypothetical protein
MGFRGQKRRTACCSRFQKYTPVKQSVAGRRHLVKVSH